MRSIVKDVTVMLATAGITVIIVLTYNIVMHGGV